jgi:hypothetical protein
MRRVAAPARKTHRNFNPTGGPDMPHTANDLQSCIEQCQRCHAVCLRTIQHCLERGGRYAETEHIRLLADCTQICAVSADFMLRGSPRHESTCGVCAEVCEQCAESCEQMGDDRAMQQCADACRACAESCRQMAGAAR